MLWRVLETQGITQYSTTESILNLLKNTTFIEQHLNLPQRKPLLLELNSLSTPIPLTTEERGEALTTFLSKNTSTHSQLVPRQKRAIFHKKHKTEHNKVASDLFRSATLKPLTVTKPPSNKQLPYDKKISVNIRQAINTSTFFQRKETKLSENYLSLAAATPTLIMAKTTRLPYQKTSPGISCVTATSDTNSTLFLVDTLVRYWTGNPHRPRQHNHLSYELLKFLN